MLSQRWAIPAVAASAALLLSAIHVSVAAPPKEPPKASAYAPAPDLTAQVEFYLNRLSESLANQADYDEAKQSRARKDASTIAALVLVLGHHDESNKYQAGAAGMIKAAQALAEGFEDYGKAKPALDAMTQAVAGKQDVPPWGEVAPLSALMKQVPVVNNSMRRSLEPSRFKKQSAVIAQQAATLAAIAQASLYDKSVAADDAAASKWQLFCEEMRDAAGAVNTAAHAGDQAAAVTAQKRMAHSCDACHAAFRHE